MTRKEKSKLFKDAHTIARRTCGIVGDYMVAFKLALKSLYRQKKLMEFESVLCKEHRMFSENSPIHKLSEFSKNRAFKESMNFLNNYYLDIAISINDKRYMTLCSLFGDHKVSEWLGIE